MTDDQRLFELPEPELPQFDGIRLHMWVEMFNNAERSRVNWAIQDVVTDLNIEWGRSATYDATQEPHRWASEAVHRLEIALKYLTPFPVQQQPPQDTQGDAQHEAATEYEPDKVTISDHG